MLKRREQTLTLRTTERCQGFSMRRLLPSDAGGACSLLFAWLSATYSRISRKALESSPERGIHTILRQRYAAQPAGLVSGGAGTQNPLFFVI